MTVITDSEFRQMRLALCNDLLSSPAQRFAVLQDLREIMQQDDLPASKWDVADTILGAIKLELGKLDGDRSDFLMIELLRTLSECCAHAETPVLVGAIAENHKNPAVRKAANDALTLLNRSLQNLWDETIADQISDIPTRARRLEQLLEMELTATETVLAIFSEMKGKPVESAQDPRLALVSHYLSDENQEIRSAAAFALLRSM